MQPIAPPDSNYYTRLGLESDPFASDALPDFFFVGAQRRFCVQRAVHALYFSGATVLLLGADGAGKTRTLDEIEKELKDLADICRIETTVLMDTAEIRGLLAAKLGLPRVIAASNAEFLQALESMRPANADPQPVLLAIDAAQLLSITTLVECLVLIAEARGRLRLLLAGEVGLATAWQQAQVGAAEILELVPLDRNESADYVRTRLQVAGYREEQLLSDAEIDSLFAQSGGNFAAINALAPQLLARSSESSVVVRRIKALPILHIGVIAVLLTIVILLILYRGNGNSQSSKELPLQIANNQIQQTQSKNKTESNRIVQNSIEQSTVALQLPASTAPTTTSSDAASAGPAEPVAIPKEAPIPVSVPALPENKNETALKKIITDKKQELKKIEVVEKSSLVEHREKPEPEKTGVEKASDKNAIAITQPSLNEDERALLAFPSAHYVLQLMGAESKTTVDKFANGAGSGLTLYCYRTQLRGKPWFIVVTGPYAGKNAAQMAQAKLPEAVRKQQPWPRTLANVQADIRAHSGH
jgi:DamX protein